METFPQIPSPSYAKPFEKPFSPLNNSFSFFSSFPFDGVDFSDTQEDSLTKDTNTPKEFTRFEEELGPDIGLLNKKIQKIPKKTRKPRKSQIELSHPLTSVQVRERRDVKKPVHEYEETRIQEEERRKKQKKIKNKTMMKEKLTKVMEIPSKSTDLTNDYKLEASYKNRDWELFFNQELSTLTQEEFFRFLKIVYEKHPECVSFEKGYAELRIIAPEAQNLKIDDKVTEFNQMQESNIVYFTFSGYLEQIKKPGVSELNFRSKAP